MTMKKLKWCKQSTLKRKKLIFFASCHNKLQTEHFLYFLSQTMIQICDECVVCFDRKDLVLFKECGHQICCADCVVNLFHKNSSSSCPFCRKLILNPRNQCISYNDVVQIITPSDIHESVKNKEDETKYMYGYFYRRIETASQAGHCQVFVPFGKNNVVADFLTRGQFRYVFNDDARGYQIWW